MSDAAPNRARPTIIIIVTSFMLFSMFFGAGNLIFPPLLGVDSGSSYLPAVVGFLGTAVLLPVLATIAISISGRNVRDLASRAGWLFGLVFPPLVYLSIGAFYALPRTGAVSYSTALQPLTGWDSWVSSGLFNLVFFGVALALAYNPSSIVDNLGRYLTPALLILLVVLIALSLLNFHTVPSTPTEEYADAPAAAGLLSGYMTMDSLAALAFAILVISTLRFKGVAEGAPLIRSTVISGFIAGGLLALIYLGLGLIGNRIADGERYLDGASLLSDAARLTMGTPGQVLFGVIVLLACITTAVGLLASTSEFFNYLIPWLSYKAWAVIFSVASLLMATMGLNRVLAIAAPVVEFIYPPAIALIIVTILEPVVARRVYPYLTYRLPIWVAVIWSAATSAISFGATAIEPLVGWAPMQAQSLGWVLPTIAAWLVGLAVDHARRRPKPEGFDAAGEAGAAGEHHEVDQSRAII